MNPFCHGNNVRWIEHSFGDALLWAAQTHGDREAIVCGAERLSFADLAERASAFARSLIDLGVAPGDKVALWMSDRPEWMVARWAVPMIGAVLVPVNTRFRDNDLAYVLEQSDTSTLILQDAARGVRYLDILSRLEPDWQHQPNGAWCSARLPMLRRVIGLAAGALPAGFSRFADIEARGRMLLNEGETDEVPDDSGADTVMLNDGSDETLRGGRTGAAWRGCRLDSVLRERIAAVRPDDVAQILYTSGTTSFPKGAQVCHGPLLQNNHQTLARMHLTAADRYLSCVPLFSATGTGYTLSMLLAGATIVIVDRFEPRLFCETVERERITMSFFVDTIVEDLKALQGRRAFDLSSLRTGTGAPLSNASFLFATHELGVPELIGVYGMSETSNAVCRADCSDPLAKRSTTNGRPVEGVRIRIADVETNATLPSGRVGEICIAGYVLMKGYYKQPDEDKKAFDAEGWLHSGDLGELDAEGYLIYRGRVKEMIKPGGFNVATQEIEVFLKSYPGVREAVVVGVSDRRLGEVGYAYVELHDGAHVEGQALQAYCKASIASYKVPRYVEFVNEWPLTGSQKIKKLELKARAQASQARAEAGSGVEASTRRHEQGLPVDMRPRRISAAELATARESATPPVLFDIRDPVEAERGHIAGATNLPRRRIEFRIGELVRDPATPIVVCGDADGRAELAASTLESLGYADVAWLDGGVAGWHSAGGSLASGSNVPSKIFGEQVQHQHQVPAVDAETLLRWQQEGQRIALCDVRTPSEHTQGCIPQAVSAPSFDIALHAADLAARHDTVVLHCAGRTRSIIGAQTLMEMGHANVVALENGTMGWCLAAHELERQSKRTLGDASPASREHAERAAARLAADAGIGRLDPAALAALLDEPRRNRYVFDVRSLAEHVAGHIAGSTALPGGQALQRADDFIAVHDARLVLVDENEARANLTATWLKRMGFPDVSVLAGGIHGWSRSGRPLVSGRARSRPLGWDTARALAAELPIDDCARWRAAHPEALVLDVGTSASFRNGHLAGTHWLPRGWLEMRIADLAPLREQSVLVTCADGSQSVYAAATLQALGYTQVLRLEGGTRAWAAAGHALDACDLAPQDDELLAPYQRGEQAMRDYIDWEKLLVPEARPQAAPAPHETKTGTARPA